MKHKRRTRKDLENRWHGKPVIGVTCEVTRLRRHFTQYDLVCDYRYIRAVLRGGGIPVLLPINPFARDIAKILKMIHGLVIVGGADIHPSFYGEKSSKKINPTYRGRTYFEMQLYAEAQKRKIPVLAICHGMQLLNVIYGGTLYHDIATEIKGVHNHASKYNPLHPVIIEKGSLLQKIFRKKSIMVYSSHHQAVKRPGRALRITAFSNDGVAEAIEGPPQTLAVQWHPERQSKDPVQSRIFRYFIRLARVKANA